MEGMSKMSLSSASLIMPSKGVESRPNWAISQELVVGMQALSKSSSTGVVAAWFSSDGPCFDRVRVRRVRSLRKPPTGMGGDDRPSEMPTTPRSESPAPPDGEPSTDRVNVMVRDPLAPSLANSERRETVAADLRRGEGSRVSSQVSKAKPRRRKLKNSFHKFKNSWRYGQCYQELEEIQELVGFMRPPWRARRYRRVCAEADRREHRVKSLGIGIEPSMTPTAVFGVLICSGTWTYIRDVDAETRSPPPHVPQRLRTGNGPRWTATRIEAGLFEAGDSQMAQTLRKKPWRRCIPGRPGNQQGNRPLGLLTRKALTAPGEPCLPARRMPAFGALAVFAAPKALLGELHGTTGRIGRRRRLTATAPS